jgi:ribosomal protein L1
VVLFHYLTVLVKPRKYWFYVLQIKKQAANEAGADYVGLDEFIAKIESGWVDIDVIIATPAVMPKIGKLGKVLRTS